MLISVSAMPDRIRVTMDGAAKTVSFEGTRMGGDVGSRRTVRQVAIRWAELTGTSYDCAAHAWRRLGLGRFQAPSKLGEVEWVEILAALDAEIAELVNDPSSRFYIYG